VCWQRVGVWLEVPCASARVEPVELLCCEVAMLRVGLDCDRQAVARCDVFAEASVATVQMYAYKSPSRGLGDKL
jgi:hypothetical protein